MSSKVLCSYVSGSYQIETGRSVLDAIRQLEHFCPDVLAIDFMLPDGNAYEVLEYIQRRKIETRTIVVTKFSNLDVIIRCYSLGAFDFLQKPITRRVFLDCLQMATSYVHSQSFDQIHSARFESQKSRMKVIRFDRLSKELLGDKEQMRDLLESSLKELQLVMARLEELSADESRPAQPEAIIFQLHHCESIGHAIFATEFSSFCASLQASIKRGEQFQPADMRWLRENAWGVMQTIEDYLKGLR